MANKHECTEFRKSMFGLDHSDPYDFIYPQWRIPRILWLAWRVIPTLYFVVWFVLSFINPTWLKWPIYLTNWAFFIHLFTCLWNLAMLIEYGEVMQGGSDVGGYMPGDLKFAWVLNNISPVFNFGVTIGYWTFVHTWGTYITPVSLHTHGITAIYSIIDIWLSARPVRLLHAYQPMAVTSLYIFFNLFYYLMGGTNRKGQRYIYPITNWSRPFTTLVFIVIFLAIVCLLHFSHWLIYIARHKLSKKLSGITSEPEDKVITEPPVQRRTPPALKQSDRGVAPKDRGSRVWPQSAGQVNLSFSSSGEETSSNGKTSSSTPRSGHRSVTFVP